MTNKRPVILMAVLLALIGAYLAKPMWEPRLYGAAPPPPPLAGDDSISNLVVSQDASGTWFADFDYYFTGKSGWAQTYLTMAPGDHEPAPGEPKLLHDMAGMSERGHHHVHYAMNGPLRQQAGLVTRDVNVVMEGGNPPHAIARARIDKQIVWPDQGTTIQQKFMAGKSADEIVADAVALIDTGDSYALRRAKQMLESLVARDPQAAPAYVELARVAMKTNWSTEGLHQAQTLVESALQIQPASVNAKILLAYIAAHQGRYKDAQALFAEVAPSNPRNLWLWANWGEAYEMQGQLEPAIAKYRETLAHPPTRDTYDHARLFAYGKLVPLLEARKDDDAVEALYRQRHDEYGAESCSNAAYARFELTHRGNADGAIAIAREALSTPCQYGPSSRAVLGMAYYVTWAAGAASAPEQSLNQARVYLPAGAQAFYMLAGSERTLPAARRLIASGEAVDQLDNERMDALALALRDRDLATARRLLRLGARPDAIVACDCALDVADSGPAGVPVALLPVIAADTDGIRLMQQSGIDYAKLHFHGTTAVELARRAGRRDLANLLDPASRSL